MKESKDWEDINVNRRKGDKVFFESTFLQQISDKIDYLKDESKEILKEVDKKGLDEIDLEEIGENTLNHVSDVVDEVSQLKSEIINSDELPQSVKESSRNIKIALNRDEDYVRRARRRLNRIEMKEFNDEERANLRVIQLCDKAIHVNDTNKDAYYLKGRALSNLGKYDDAIEEFITSLAIMDDINVMIAIADANRLNGDYDDAISVYDSVIEKDWGSFDAFKGKALTYYACEDYKNADEAFRKANNLTELDKESETLWQECQNKI
jgi:tetratricopeptide (TPR) repeat protein